MMLVLDADTSGIGKNCNQQKPVTSSQLAIATSISKIAILYLTIFVILKRIRRCIHTWNTTAILQIVQGGHDFHGSISNRKTFPVK